MQNLSFIDTLTDEVLTEMLELISLEYDNFHELFEELLSEELILSEVVDSAQIRKEQRERTERLRAAAKKGTRLRSRQQTAQAAEKVNKGIQGKYDRRPWYKKAFGKLKKWVGKGVQALKDRSKEDDSEVVYTTAPSTSARRTSNTTTTTTTPNPQETPKPKTETQKRAETLRAKRQATETKKQNNFKNFRKKAQESRFKRMARPMSPAALAKKNTTPTQPQQSAPSQPQQSTNRPNPLQGQPKKKVIPTPTFAARKQRKTRLNITNNQGQSTTMRP
jgi:hypothetical protein